MIRFAAFALLLLAGSAGALSQGESPVPKLEAAPARDGDIAIREELCAAREAGTAAAYDLFIARHPNHPLADKARAERDKLSR